MRARVGRETEGLGRLEAGCWGVHRSPFFFSKEIGVWHVNTLLCFVSGIFGKRRVKREWLVQVGVSHVFGVSRGTPQGTKHLRWEVGQGFPGIWRGSAP